MSACECAATRRHTQPAEMPPCRLLPTEAQTRSTTNGLYGIKITAKPTVQTQHAHRNSNSVTSNGWPSGLRAISSSCKARALNAHAERDARDRRQRRRWQGRHARQRWRLHAAASAAAAGNAYWEATTARTSTMAPLRSGSVAASIVSTEPMSTSSAEGFAGGGTQREPNMCAERTAGWLAGVRNGSTGWSAGRSAKRPGNRPMPKGQVAAPAG